MAKKQRFIQLTILALAAADIFIWYAIVFGGPARNTELYFLNIGQGDSSLVVLPGGVKVLIDGGPGPKVLSELAKALPLADRYIDLVVVSHPQLDHFGGLIDVLKNYQVGAFIDNGRQGTAKAYAELEKIIAAKKIRHIVLKEGDAVKYNDAVFAVLGPSARDLPSQELNDTCIVMMLQEGNLRALYTGDIGANVEDELIKKYDLSAQVLKVGHHGSRFSSSLEFLAAVQPKISVIEVGKNRYGHPTLEALNRLADAGTQIYRTDRDGLVKVVLDGQKLLVYK